MKTRSEKVYVKVNVDCDSKGYMTPKAITWSDGRIFIIEKVKEHCPTSTIARGYTGDCYTKPTFASKGNKFHMTAFVAAEQGTAAK